MSRDTARSRKGANSKKKAQIQQQERERLQREVLLHAQELAAEMNLRLVLDWETGAGGEDSMLFVESIVVTDISYPVETRRSFFGRAKIFFMGIFAYINGLLRPKHRRTGYQAPQQFR